MTEHVTLASLAATRCWVAWQVEARKLGEKPTKVPYSPGGYRASANKPASWGTREAAAKRAALLPRPFGLGGVGLEFTTLGDGRCTGGIDLDSCRDPSSGKLLAWARGFVDQLASYTEVSPSGTGVKIFFTFDAADYLKLRAALGRTSEGALLFSKNWKLPADNHPPGVEVHLGNRYFATTFDILPGSPEALRTIPTVDLLRLIQVDVPHFIVEHGGEIGESDIATTQMRPKNDGRPAASRRPRKANGSVDTSRSAAAFAIGGKARREGADFNGMCDALRVHPHTADWFAEKGSANGGRELHRIWEKTDPTIGEVILSRGKPLESARQFVLRRHTLGEIRTLLHQNATFYTWHRSHYRECPMEEMRSQLYAFLDTAKAISDEGEVIDFDPTRTRVANVMDALAAEVQLSNQIRPPAWLVNIGGPAAAEIVCCANKLLHLATGDTCQHTPSFFTLNALPFDYQPGAPAPTHWLAFLKSIWSDDEESISTLQEMFGLCLTGQTQYQKAFLLVGPKRSGKGTIARILTQLIGPDNVASPTLSGLGTNFGLAPLIGKRVAIVSDARLSGRADQQVIVERLLSVTGEDGLTIDRKFLESWTGKLNARFVILTNEMPRLTDSSGALASRFVVIRMVQSFYGKEDLSLGSRLEPELPGILCWAIAGWRRLTQRGFFVSPESSADVHVVTWKTLGSPYRCIPPRLLHGGPGKVCLIRSRLYNHWRAWCQDQGREHPGSKQTFGRDLAAAVSGLKTTQPRDQNGKQTPTILRGCRTFSRQRDSASDTRFGALHKHSSRDE